MVRVNVFNSLSASLCLLIILVVVSSYAAPMPSGDNTAYYNEIDETPEDLLMDLIARFDRTIYKARKDFEATKRAVDFGLSRGFSGTQEARHRLGLAAANFAGGPGRRRRSERVQE
ncbi:Dh31 family protein [Megaselia abdita]